MVKGHETLNDILVVLFNEIMDIEGKAIITGEFRDISNNDMHIIEAVGTGAPKNMSTIAKTLAVTVGTLTTTMNSLVKKGYAIRQRCEEDRRVVYMALTDKGKRAFLHHQAFHQEMIEAVMEGMGDEEKRILIGSLNRLREFFRQYHQ